MRRRKLHEKRRKILGIAIAHGFLQSVSGFSLKTLQSCVWMPQAINVKSFAWAGFRGR
jgi:hypothetical protein